MKAQSICNVFVQFNEANVAKLSMYDKDSLIQAEKLLYEAVKGQLNGNGFVYKWNEQTYVITCAHVVQKSLLGDVKVKFGGNAIAYDMKVLGADTFLDIAVLQDASKNVNWSKLSGFNFPSTFNFTQTATLHTIFNGQEQLQQVQFKGWEQTEIAYQKLQIETNKSIEEGMSGSPIIVNQEVVGLLCSKSSANQGKCLDGKTLAAAIQKIIQSPTSSHKTIARVFTGFVFAKGEKGVYLHQVLDESPNPKLKKYEGQIISTINGKNISSLTDIFNLFENAKPRDVFQFSFGTSQVQVFSEQLKDLHFEAIAKSYFKNNTNYELHVQANHLGLWSRKTGKHIVIQRVAATNGTFYGNTQFLVRTAKDLGACVRLFAQYGSFRINDEFPIFNLNENQHIPLLYY